MISDMATIDPPPNHDTAMADLDAVADAQRLVRDRRWPAWLYPANALLLGAIALTPMLPEPTMLGGWIVLLLGVFLLNYWAGHLIGTPFAVPTSRGFRAALAAAVLFLVAAMTIGHLGGPPSLALACAAGTMISYGIGSVVHYRSTRR